MERRKLVARLKKADLPAGAMRRVIYSPFHVLVVNLGGVPYAIDDTCNHAGDSLARGELSGCVISCPAHGYLFDVRTGHLIEPAGLCDAQRTFEVTAEGDEFAIYDHVLALVLPANGEDEPPSGQPSDSAVEKKT
ncbi:MAG TPA: Rieske 2Fe-2S domain-containing protein [Polyangiaceae bacterium]|nr:Rieske 2Fe-2S domain-containing protein [Polyangiaceae bacterium]